MRDFFNIKEDYYRFEIYDLTAILTILNVVFVLMGYWWAPIFGLVNCAICLTMNVVNRLHIKCLSHPGGIDNFKYLLFNSVNGGGCWQLASVFFNYCTLMRWSAITEKRESTTLSANWVGGWVRIIITQKMGCCQ